MNIIQIIKNKFYTEVLLAVPFGVMGFVISSLISRSIYNEYTLYLALLGIFFGSIFGLILVYVLTTIFDDNS